MTGLRPIYRMWQLAWWKWARHDLQRKSPTHPDLPYVLLKIAMLEAA